MTDQIFLIPTAFGKSSDLTVSGGYQHANGPPRALLSESVDHDHSCQHSDVADGSNLTVITAPSRCCPESKCCERITSSNVLKQEILRRGFTLGGRYGSLAAGASPVVAYTDGGRGDGA